MLQDIRGVEDVEEELKDIKAACEEAAQVENPWRTILKPAYRPQLVIALTSTFFQQWTGINTCGPAQTSCTYLAAALSHPQTASPEHTPSWGLYMRGTRFGSEWPTCVVANKRSGLH